MRRIMRVEFGSIFPFLVTGLLTAAGGAWNASIVSEWVSYPGGESKVEGIGALIAEACQSRDAEAFARLGAATICVAGALVLINRLVWKPLQRLASTRFALNR
jgi:NitT/TauT family transport system permease protein